MLGMTSILTLLHLSALCRQTVPNNLNKMESKYSILFVQFEIHIYAIIAATLLFIKKIFF